MANSIKKPGWYIPESKVTPEDSYFSRRKFITGMGAGIGGMIFNGCLSKSGQKILSVEGRPVSDCNPDFEAPDFEKEPYANIHNEYSSPEGQDKFTGKWGLTPEYNPGFTGGRALTESYYPLNYNNYYEFSTSKSLVAPLSENFTSEPWMLRVHGLVNNELTLDLDDLINLAILETRVYRHRCVEAWAMTVPWIGYPLSKLLNIAGPTSGARYVKFLSFHRPEEAPGQKNGFYVNNFPYYEGLTLAEAMNELTLLTFGLYDVTLPRQNGAPLRVVVPWKYGYKGPKGVVDMELTDTQPRTFWNDLQPTEYSFSSNVNPCEPHPRWSQANERLLGPEPLDRVPTQVYNGYGEWVSHLYN